MARFPSKEAGVSAPAEEIMTGSAANAPVYPLSPCLRASTCLRATHRQTHRQAVTVADLAAAFGGYMTADNAATAVQAAAEQATATKDEAFEALTDAMRADLRYAENTVNFDDDQLKLIGWGGPKARTSLEAPGQARTLEAPRRATAGFSWTCLRRDGRESDLLDVLRLRAEMRRRQALHWPNERSAAKASRARIRQSKIDETAVACYPTQKLVV